MIHTTRERWRVTVVVPTLDEASTVGAVLDEVAPYADELIVVDGGSGDGTGEVARRRGVRVVEDDGRGKGGAIRLGLRLAAHPIVVFVDADGSHEARDIPALVAPIRRGEADVVVGSRMTGGSDELFSTASEFVRLTGSMLINLAINYRWGVRLSDTQNGFRAVARDPIAALGMTERGTTIEQEMVMKALAAGLRVMNVPSHEYMRRGGVSKIDVRKVWLRYVYNVLRHVLRPGRRERLAAPPAAGLSAPRPASLRTLDGGADDGAHGAGADARRAGP